MKRLLALALLVLAAAQAQAANVNVAFGAPTFGNGPIYANDPLRKLTDGDHLPQIHADTTPPTGFAYWLDLGSSHALTSIKLWPRQDFPCCPERLSNIRVSVHNDDGGGNIGAEVWGANLFPPPSNAGSGPGVVVNVTAGMGAGTFAGRWLKLTALTDPVPDYSLQVTEIEAFADEPANLSLGAATASTEPLYAGWPTAWLVNGNLTDQVHGDAPSAGFAYTINLGAVANLDHINVFARQDGCCPERLSNYRVSVHQDSGGALGAEVWGANLHTDGSNPGSGPGVKDVITSVLDLGGNFQGQWIQILSLDDPVPPYALQIAEVAVHGALVQPLLNVVSQPQPAVGYLGQPVVFTFNVTVVDGDQGLVTYQWKSNNVNITGATSASYTNKSVTTFDETNLWKCVVSYPGLPSLTSDEVGLDIDYAYGAAAYANGPLWGPGGWNISRIVDGYRGAGFAGVHGDTAPPLGFAYWFDMHTTVFISNIVVWARQDGNDACCATRLTNYRLTVHDDDNGAIGGVVWTADIHADGSNPGAHAGSKDVIIGDLDPFVDFTGRWIMIQSLQDPVPDYALQITEVEVFGSVPPGITIYITQQPADASSSPFRTASFSMSAAVLNGSFANLSYQWQRNGVNIPGAVSNSFTTPLLCADDEGAKYRCVVSYPGASSIMTREATLTFDYNYARGSAAYNNQPLWIPGGWNIGMLVDGNRLGVFHGDTGIQPGFAYTINMGFPVDIDRIDIYPRQDGCCPERFTKVRVSVHNDDGLGAIGDPVWVADLYADGSNPGSGPGIVVSATAGLDVGGLFSGQWIKLESLEDPVQNYALQVTELEVIGKARALCWKIAPGGGLVLSWDHGTLESALNVTGTWGEVIGATSPMPISYTGEKKFFRLRIP